MCGGPPDTSESRRAFASCAERHSARCHRGASTKPAPAHAEWKPGHVDTAADFSSANTFPVYANAHAGAGHGDARGCAGH